MRLSLPFIKNKENNELYLGLFVKEVEVVGFVFEKHGERLELIVDEKRNLTNSWDNLLEDVDELIFSLEQKTKKHLEKAIFFVYSNLIDQNTKEIKKTYIPIFKDIVKHLELKPLGYIECYEAIASYFEKKEQSPLTAILVEIEKSNIGVFIYKGGHKSFSKNILRTDQIVNDLEGIFTDVKDELMLPSRIILYDSYNLHAESSMIISHRWASELFIQHPRVEIVNPSELNKGLMQIFGNQINADDFVVAKEGSALEEKKDVMGFTIGQEVEHKKEVNRVEEIEEAGEEPKGKIRSGRLGILGKVNVLGILKRLGKFGRLGRLGMMGLLFIFLALFAMEYFFHKANLNILFPSKMLSKSVDLSILVGDSSGQGFQIKSATLSADLSDKKNTTGKRDVGDKATGEVTIYNLTTQSLAFNKGTDLTTNGIKFVLADDVKVVSAQISSSSGDMVSGKSKVKVQAANIGPDGNVGAGQKFTLSGLVDPSFVKNDNAFTGGSKKQVGTVSKQDIQDLKDSILKKAKEEAVSKLKTSSSSGEELIDTLTDTNLDNIKLSKELGEEASNLTMNASANTAYFTYSPKDVRGYLKSTFKGDIPSGFRLDEDKITFEFQDTKQVKDNISLTILAKAQILKDVAKSDIVNKIVGKRKTEIEKLLKDDFQASGYEIKTSSSLFFLDYWLPFFKKNISLTVSSL